MDRILLYLKYLISSWEGIAAIVLFFVIPMTLIVISDKKVKKANGRILEIENEIYNLNASKDRIIEQYKEDARSKLEFEYQSLINNIKDLEGIVDKYNEDLMLVDVGLFYDTNFTFEQSELYKNLLTEIREAQKQMIKNKSAFSLYYSNTSKEERLLVRALNKECDALISSITAKNIIQKKNQLSRAFETLNNLSVNVKLSPGYLNIKLREMDIAYEYSMKLEVEKEVLREEREKEREEKKAQIEINKKKQLLEKEIAKLNNTLSRLEAKLLSANDTDAISLQYEIDNLKSNIELMENEKQDLDYRLEHLGAGYVYIISNIGSFGENMYKIGVTRRLDPYERIQELSSASVPFKFDVHAMIFSYNAYELESELHNHFSNHRRNKVNFRKEFFDVEISEIKEILNKHENLVFDYMEEPDAIEYRQTLKLLEG